MTAESRGYGAPIWATYKQWADLGAQVRKSEKCAPVIFYRKFETDPEPDNPEDDGKRRVARASSVFNADQVDGFELSPQPEELGPVARTRKFSAARAQCQRLTRVIIGIY